MRLQRDYGEEFLSVTCATYPRLTRDFGKFFERSLTPTCPVAAELILFQEEPMKFSLTEVPEKIHSNGGKIGIGKILIAENQISVLFEIQLAMISILQERRFSLDQRLIVLGLFHDKLQELFSSNVDRNTLLSLIAAYESEEFLMGELSPLIQSISTDSKKFVVFIMKFLQYTLSYLNAPEGRDFIKALSEVLELKPDEKDSVPVLPVINSYEALADARKNFLENYSTFLENYLVNELFMNHYPWRFREESITKNYAVFLISYKIFELMVFTATQNGLSSKENLLRLVDWFTTKTNHNKALYNRFFELLKGIDDTLLLMTCLLRG